MSVSYYETSGCTFTIIILFRYLGVLTVSEEKNIIIIYNILSPAAPGLLLICENIIAETPETRFVVNNRRADERFLLAVRVRGLFECIRKSSGPTRMINDRILTKICAGRGVVRKCPIKKKKKNYIIYCLMRFLSKFHTYAGHHNIVPKT